MGFRMQTPDNKVSVVDMQPKGNLPLLKPDDMQYFDKLLVSFSNSYGQLCLQFRAQSEERLQWISMRIGV